jgi:hypothetical protein
VHDAPHVAMSLLLAHAPLHMWKFALQLKPQLVPSQVAVALPGGAHGVHVVPQLFVSVSLTHVAPQR